MKINITWVKLIIIFVGSNLMASLASSEEVSLGNAKAPVTFIEYGSFTCDYCISFHRNIFPRIKKNYIDEGTVRFIFRHFPTSEAAVHAAVAAQCSGDKFYEMLDMLYSTVPGWYRAESRNGVFVQQATSLGLNSDEFLSCISDKKQFDDIENQQQVAKKNYGVTGTPTFFINEKMVRGKKSFAEIKVLISEAINNSPH